MAETFNLVLYPQVQDGESVDEVKEKLCTTLSVDAATVDTWYATDSPTAILKDVEEETGAKYVEAILGCGAQANLQPSGEDKSAWSLEQMTKAEFTDLFICPSCEHEEEYPRGEKPEQCPKCGLVIAKWEEKMKEEAEKEKIRRRLMRDQRLQGDEAADREAKKAELERLRKLEREIMLELGIKPPGPLWMFFEKYTIPVSFAVTVMIIAATGVMFHFVDQWLDQQAYEEKVAEPASDDIQGIAPVMAAAVQLQQNGNSGVVTEIADATQLLNGTGNQARQQITEAAQQMMKGVQPEAFIGVAQQMSLPSTVAKVSPGEVEPARVNVDTIGGVSGLTGVTDFAPTQLDTMSPPLLEHGHEKILAVLTDKQLIKDQLNPEGPEIVVEAIDEMDGSAIVTLMSSIGKDQEWDQYLLSEVKQYVLNTQVDEAGKLAERIENPVSRIHAYGAIMEEHQINENLSELKAYRARVRLDLDKIADPDIRARVILELGEKMADAGSEDEPYDAMDRVATLATDSESPKEESSLVARLAVSKLRVGDQAGAERDMQRAMNIAGRITDLSDRISAFTKLAQRYYDVRNVTLASEILAEASVIAATRLEHEPRSVAFGEIALARAYVGDLEGARQAIRNAAQGEGEQQLISKIAEMLLGEGRYYEALSWMETLTDDVEYARLELRLSSALFYAGRRQEALNRMEQSAPRMQLVYEHSERGLLTSQYARFFARLGRQEKADQLFEDAEEVSEQLTGRKAQVNLALVALDRARVFQLAWAKEIVREELTDTVVRDPIDAEILATERIVKNLLPEGRIVEPQED
jgi:tetratricopeptide (TPR) repeat protein